jgi:hypothetical protein
VQTWFPIEHVNLLTGEPSVDAAHPGVTSSAATATGREGGNSNHGDQYGDDYDRRHLGRSQPTAVPPVR